MEYFFKHWSEIITAAASSTFGLLALMILVMGALAYVFFKNAPIRVRVAIFIMLFVGVVGFTFTVIHRTVESAKIEQVNAEVPKPVQSQTNGYTISGDARANPSSPQNVQSDVYFSTATGAKSAPLVSKQFLAEDVPVGGRITDVFGRFTDGIDSMAIVLLVDGHSHVMPLFHDPGTNPMVPSGPGDYPYHIHIDPEHGDYLETIEVELADFVHHLTFVTHKKVSVTAGNSNYTLEPPGTLPQKAWSDHKVTRITLGKQGYEIIWLVGAFGGGLNALDAYSRQFPASPTHQ